MNRDVDSQLVCETQPDCLCSDEPYAPDVRDPEVVRAAFKGRAFAVHPDRGGTHKELLEVHTAYETARLELGFS